MHLIMIHVSPILGLKDQKLQYYVIDQNIATVVQGNANKALFERFFAKLNADGQTIDEHGAMTMIAKMVQEGYMKLTSTNNLGTEYCTYSFWCIVSMTLRGSDHFAKGKNDGS